MGLGIADIAESNSLDLKVMNVEYTESPIGGTVVHLFGRDRSEKWRHIEVDGHQPSFFIHEDAYSERIDNHYAVTGTTKYNNTERYESLEGEPLVRVYTTTPEMVGEMRDLFDRTWEADILYEKRWLIDNGAKTGVRIDTSNADYSDYVSGEMRVSNTAVESLDLDDTPTVDPKQLVVDIEVAAEDGVPQTDTAQYPVSTIVAWDSHSEAYVGWILESDEWSGNTRAEVHGELAGEEALLEEADLDDLRAFDDESSMLDDFHRYVEKQHADIITGWYCVPEGEPVQMADGSQKAIEDISEGDVVVGKDGEGVVETEVKKTAETGTQPTVEIQTQHGKPLRVSEDHPVLVADDEEPRYVDAADVTEGQYVLTPKTLPSKDSGGPSVERAYQIGLIASDGSFSEDDGVVFYNKREELHDAFDTDNAPSEANGTMKQRVFTDVSREEAVERCTEIGLPLERKDYAEWSLEPVYEWRTEAVEAFLSGLFDGDGHVSDGNIAISNGNDSARYWIERLCRRVGVWATDDGKMNVHVGASSVERFADAVGTHVRHSKKAARLEHVEDGAAGREGTIPPYVDAGGGTGTDARRIVNDKKRRDINIKRHEVDVLGGDPSEHEDFVFDRVTSVEDGNEKTCYDLETGTHNFVVNDRVVHNCNDFDIPYLVNRSKNLTVYSYQDWSPLGNVYIGGWEPVVNGVSTVDMLEAYKKTQIHKLKKKGLDDVAEKEGLDDGKVDIDLSHTEMWRQRPVEFLRYNKLDVQLVHEIDDSSGAIELLDNLRAVVGCRYEAPLGGNIEMMDMLFLRKADEYGLRLPTAEEPEVGDYHGAYVYTPEAGLHENVVYPDYSSLYPNIMYQCNISPETLIGTREDLEASEYTEDDCVWSYIDTETPPPQKSDVEADEDVIEKVYFLDPSVEEGFIRSVLDDVMGLAAQYTGGMYAAVKRVRNSCLTPDSEVLTPDGVANITDVCVGDEVYSWNPETDEMEVKEVVDTIEHDDADTVHHIDTNGVDLKLTDDHDLWVNRWRKSGGWEKTAVGDLNEYTDYQLPHSWTMDGTRVETVDIRNWVDDYEVRVKPNCHGRTFAAATDWTAEHNGNGVYYLTSDDFDVYEDEVREHASKIGIQTRRTESDVPMEYDADNFIKLAAWYTTEGSIYTSERETIGETTRGECTTIRIAQENESHRTEIRTLLDDMGLSYYEGDGSFDITGATALAEALGEMCGRGSYDKRLPEWMFDASPNQREMLLDTLMAGDGDKRAQNRYSTASEELRDDVCKLLVTLGETPRYRTDSGVCRVSWRPDATNSFTRSRSVTEEDYDGSVHCLTVEDNHTFVAGRNGNFSVVGNCYGVLGDSDSYGAGFRLFDWLLAEATTLGGQRVLKEGGRVFANMMEDDDAEVVYGDTDSVVTTVPNADDGEDALQQALDAAEAANEHINEYAVEQFGLDSIEDARMELEIESYARGIFFKGDDDGKSSEGVKKKYVQLEEWMDSLDACESHDAPVLDCGSCRASGWLDDPCPEVKGFAYVRSDIADVTADLQYEAFEALFEAEDPEGAVKDVVCETIEDIMHGEYDMNKIGLPFGISQSLDEYGSPDRKPQPQYRGGKYANKFIYEGESIQSGDKPLMYYIKEGQAGPLRKTYDSHTREDGQYVDAVSVHDYDDMPDGMVVDREKMIQKVIIDKMEAICRTMGWGVDWMEDCIEDAKEPEDYRDEGQRGLEEMF